MNTTQATPTVFANVMIIDGSGDPPFAGDVRVEGNRIATVSRQPNSLPANGADVVDGGGATLMPGLTEAHSHLTFINAPSFAHVTDMPVEEHVLWTMKAAKLILDHGFTSCFSGSAAKPRLDVVIRDAINAGDIPGPRLRAASKQLTVTGGFGDCRRREFDPGENMPSVPLNGPDAFRDYARLACRDGVDTIKIVPSGGSNRPGSQDEDTLMTDEEVAAVCTVAHQRGRKVAAHARSAESVKICLRNGVEVIYHANHFDDEAMDMLEAARDRMFVAPALGIQVARLNDAADYGIVISEAGRAKLAADLDELRVKMRQILDRGVRVLPGGDYGFTGNPLGNNARDLAHFVNLLGFAPMDVLVAATRWGGALMGHEGELGEVREGRLADLLLVDGDPLEDISILQDRDRLVTIMKDGAFHKPPPATHEGRQRHAAE